MFCTDISEPTFLIISNEAPALLYYSHLPTIFISLLIGIFIFIKQRKLLISKILFFLNIVFGMWVFFSLITWTHVDTRHILFSWSLIGLLFVFISFLSFYFAYVFVNKKPLNRIWRLLWLTLFIPVLIFTPTSFNLTNFDLAYCIATENFYFNYYYYFTGLFSFASILFIAAKAYKQADSEFRKQIIYATIGIESFLLSFFFASFLASYLVDLGVVTDFQIEKYGLFGMIIFMSFLAFLIVRFKAFNIKLLGAQALVVALIILIGSQFAFIESNVNRLLTAITLLISASIGFVLIRSVRKVDDQRELLAQANQEQEILIHFISHQIKGFFTKSRNIFSTILDEENAVEKSLKPLIEEGLRSDKEGIELVGNILNAANLKTGKMKYNKTEFDLIKFVHDIAEKNKMIAEKKNLKINFPSDTLGQKEIIVNADADRMKDVFHNIIQNSINYTPKGGINVAFEKTGNAVNVIIKDTGIGLSPSDKLKLFKSGARGDESLKHNVNSTGYGLYIAHKVVVDHGGKITADSKGRDMGSTFTITLPLR